MKPPDNYGALSSFKSYIPSPLGKKEARGKRVMRTMGGRSRKRRRSEGEG